MWALETGPGSNGSNSLLVKGKKILPFHWVIVSYFDEV